MSYGYGVAGFSPETRLAVVSNAAMFAGHTELQSATGPGDESGAIAASVPPLEGVPPVFEDVPPVLDDVPPVLDDVPPVLDDVPPVFDDGAPPVEGAPPLDGAAPPLDVCASPPVDEAPPLALADLPPVDAVSPPDDASGPSVTLPVPPLPVADRHSFLPAALGESSQVKSAPRFRQSASPEHQKCVSSPVSDGDEQCAARRAANPMLLRRVTLRSSLRIPAWPRRSGRLRRSTQRGQ